MERYKFEPVLELDPTKSSLLINKLPSTIKVDSKSYACETEVRLDILPRPSLHLYNNLSKVEVLDITKIFSFDPSVKLYISKSEASAIQLSSKSDTISQEVSIKWCPRTNPIIGVGNDNTSMSSVIFHLFNFTNFREVDRLKEGNDKFFTFTNALTLENDKYIVKIKSHSKTDEFVKQIDENDDCLITHIAQFYKTDKTYFTGKEASDFLIELGCFLSFSKGERCNPICAYGFDDSNSRIWESWNYPTNSYHIPFSWFSPNNGSQLIHLFPGFHKRWEHDGWRDALKEVIYWYLNANTPDRGLDSSIILSQAGIERLSFEYAVKHKKLILDTGFKDLRASDKFRLLFSSLNLPLDIPSNTLELQRFASSEKYYDSPHLLTEIRNSIIHPASKKKKKFNNILFEAWKLSLWYLEMSILAICDYNDTYVSRIDPSKFAKKTEPVPWK